MASADSSHFVVTTIWRSRERPPRVSTLSFFPCRFLIYPTSFRIGIGLRVQWHTHPLAWPCMRFLFVTSRICRWLPSPCSSRSTSCLKLGLGPISPTTGLAPARTAHMSRDRVGGRVTPSASHNTVRAVPHTAFHLNSPHGRQIVQSEPNKQGVRNCYSHMRCPCVVPWASTIIGRFPCVKRI